MADSLRVDGPLAAVAEITLPFSSITTSTVTKPDVRIRFAVSGYMGGGIAQVFAMAGLDVVIVDADPALTGRNLDRLRLEAEDFESRGLFAPGSAELVHKARLAHPRFGNKIDDAEFGACFVEPALQHL